ncbi:uncharacterized protein LOC21409808 isoform X2 [Morus notabilis]|uniref:uncharacterized protein LOC21409808 isoform X2 n=1 Tax=Morus notabilis TaxID=981085 RepID=UPI000CED6ECF|nr:uncharacterized protein LOC21409808 isoform X2 [Morus notabilis]
MNSGLCDFGELSIKYEGDVNGDISSDELDHVPLLRRRSMLMANKRHLHLVAELIAVENGSENPLLSRFVVKEDGGRSASDLFSFMPACSSSEVGAELLEKEQNHENKDSGEDTPKALSNNIVEYSTVDQCLQNGTCGQDMGTSGDCHSCLEQIKCQESNDNFAEVGKIDSSICSLPQNSTLSEVPTKVKVEFSDMCSMEGGVNSSCGADVPTINVKHEILDHIAYDHLRDHVDYDHLDHIVLKERQSMLLSRKLLAKPVLENSSEALAGNLTQQCAEKELEDSHVVIGQPLTTKSRFDDIAENNDGLCSTASANSMKGSSFSISFKIKDEPQDENNCHNSNSRARDTFSSNLRSVKTETEISNELDEDEADHVCLGDRVKMLRSEDDSVLNLSRSYECLKKSVPFVPECVPIALESVKGFNIRPRKRKKTATDSVETALEEDAPGLLEVLVEKGVSIDEIKLYGEMESDEALDESSSESFSELEAVISKLFTQRNSFLKLAPVRFTKGARASYCLACLISLVEQTRYLQFRKWPVEWGWCRDLQSFIFIFERHNRIVLERPEYGYATYFFELVDSLPIEWQIKRLVTAMKLTTCSRISLIENKALTVGEDLTEGEAQVLIEYGWVPNSGLGTMLNYCDRVVHDRKNEKDEWRSKIGKLLMDGYNGGTIVSTDMPKKVTEYRDSHSAQIKLELQD